MAVALTPFTALCGFRDPNQILDFALEITEFAEVLGENTMEVLRSNEAAEVKLRNCYQSIFRPVETRDLLPLQTRLLARVLGLASQSWAEEFRTLMESFPGKLNLTHKFLYWLESPAGDPGCFAPLLLNIYRLDPGEAIFVPAGEIHAYLSGDCIEAMTVLAGSRNHCLPGLIMRGQRPVLRPGPAPGRLSLPPGADGPRDTGRNSQLFS